MRCSWGTGAFVEFAPSALAISSDHKLVASSGWNHLHVNVWRAPSGERLRRLDASARALAFPPDVRELAVVSADGAVFRSDVTTSDAPRHTARVGAPRLPWIRPDRKTCAVGWLPDRRVAAVLCEGADVCGSLEGATAATTLTSPAPWTGPLRCRLDEAAGRVAVADGQGPLRVWDLESGRMEG